MNQALSRACADIRILPADNIERGPTVNSEDVTLWPMDMETRRFVLLLRELGEEIKSEVRREKGGRTDIGWQRRLAARVGLDAGYVNKLLNGVRLSVGKEAIAKVIDNIDVNESFIYGEAEPKTYRDYLRKRNPGFVEFLATPMGKIAKRRHPQYVQILENMPLPADTPAFTYQSVYAALVMGAEQAEAMKATTEAAIDQLLEDRISRPIKKRDEDDE